MNFPKIALVTVIALSITGCSAPQTTAPMGESSWSDGACTKEKQGVTLAIDYLGQVSTHCALKFAGDGWKLFSAAGFSVKGTAKYPTAFACQIEKEPKAAKCDDSDSSGAYWGYYILTDGKWGYATTGAADHKTVCGETEGWVYMESEKTQSHLPSPAPYTCN